MKSIIRNTHIAQEAHRWNGLKHLLLGQNLATARTSDHLRFRIFVVVLAENAKQGGRFVWGGTVWAKHCRQHVLGFVHAAFAFAGEIPGVFEQFSTILFGTEQINVGIECCRAVEQIHLEFYYFFNFSLYFCLSVQRPKCGNEGTTTWIQSDDIPVSYAIPVYGIRTTTVIVGTQVQVEALANLLKNSKLTFHF